ncbi:ABC transporter substrate-binding protein [Actinocrispum wychmicini]|uniref:Thiamine pyrimidine synthase n=1 Tax=Actinocrispum wychmicini TaxID=1213861 RepID=A0A4R2J910_9PSEU|nr:ABC transporter substrate-binding protein [Actinocrispum wychmicini]TCO55801.1 ABC-type nitrate/sulfonate/bicarbonate transport system substrate-binding protein [Actinocrispum wychmicini]
MTQTISQYRVSRRSLLRTVGQGASVAAAGMWLAGCGTSGDVAAGSSAAKGRVSVKLGWIPNVEYSGIFLGVQNGFYARQGLEVEVVPGGPNSAVVPLVTTNRVSVGIEAIPENVVTAVNGGAKLKIVGAGLVRSPECWVSRAERAVRTPQDIEGKKLGVTLSGKNTALVFMRKNGVDVGKVTLVPIQFDPAPLAAGEVDAIWGFASNQPVSLGLRGIQTHVMPLADHGFNRMQSVFFVSQATLDDPTGRENTRKFLAGSKQGWDAAVKDHQHAAQVTIERYGKDLGLKLDEQIQVMSAMAPYVTGPDTGSKGLLWMSDTLIGETIESLGSIGITADRSLFTNELLEG